MPLASAARANASLAGANPNRSITKSKINVRAEHVSRTEKRKSIGKRDEKLQKSGAEASREFRGRGDDSE